jgi:putative transposase
MKLTLQTRLLPDAAASARLKATVERFNEACNWLAGVVFEAKRSNRLELQRIAYRELRERFALPADTAIRAIARVADAFKRDKTKRPRFRKHAAVPYSMGKNIGFKGTDRVSISTLAGRVVVPFLMGAHQAERMGLKKGQCDLVLRKDGKWFLLVTVDVPERTRLPATDFLGVDLGIAQLATDSDGNAYSGAPIEQKRRKFNSRRKALGRAAGAKRRKGRQPKVIRRAQRLLTNKEARYRRDVNHGISKAIVGTAERSGRGIALENLKGIRGRVKARGGDARNRLGGWAFAQLGTFLQYKARLAGVAVVRVEARNTSRQCAECGHIDKANRPSQSEFRCRACGHEAHADANAARNIRARALVSGLKVAERHGAHPPA